MVYDAIRDVSGPSSSSSLAKLLSEDDNNTFDAQFSANGEAYDDAAALLELGNASRPTTGRSTSSNVFNLLSDPSPIEANAESYWATEPPAEDSDDIAVPAQVQPEPHVPAIPYYSAPSPLPPSLQPRPLVLRGPIVSTSAIYDPVNRLTAPRTMLVPLLPHEAEPDYSKCTRNILRTSLPTFLAPSKKRKLSPAAEQPKKKQLVNPHDALQVAQHYNLRPNIGLSDRSQSPIIGLKNFNNWIKTVLINKFCRSPIEEAARQKQLQNQPRRRGGHNPAWENTKLKVLDMGCGKGGDLNKWGKVGTGEYVGLDVANVSIEQARSRVNRNHGFTANFFALDCFSESISNVVSPQLLAKKFDVVSMQFCMHYAFENIEKARMMLTNVSTNLRFGGMFVGTIPNSDLLLERLQAIPDDIQPPVFGNSRYRVTFDAKAEDPSAYPIFGHRYSFYLQDAVDDVPEYVVQWQAFRELAQEYGLDLVYYAKFDDVFLEEKENPEFAQLMTRMNVINAEGESDMDEEMWEAATIYVAFAFIKARDVGRGKQQVQKA